MSRAVYVPFLVLTPLWVGLALVGCFKSGNEVRQVEERRDNLPTLTRDHFAVGAVKVSGQTRCIGFFSSQSEVTTARGCVATASADQVTVSFSNQAIEVTEIKALSDAIVVLTVAGSDRTRSVLELARIEAGAPLFVLSRDYSSEEGMGQALRPGATLVQAGGGLLHYKANLQKGSAGSPLIQSGKVVGIHLGQRSSGGNRVGVELSFNGTLPSDLKLELW